MISTLLNQIHFKAFNFINQRGITTSQVFSNTTDQPRPSTKHLHRVNKLERRMLVWTGKFKTLEDVPGVVPPEVMEKARSRIRIRVANWMMGITLVVCAIVTYVGRRAHKSGDSLEKRNLEMHRLYQEKHANKSEE